MELPTTVSSLLRSPNGLPPLKCFESYYFSRNINRLRMGAGVVVLSGVSVKMVSNGLRKEPGSICCKHGPSCLKNRRKEYRKVFASRSEVWTRMGRRERRCTTEATFYSFINIPTIKPRRFYALQCGFSGG